MNTDLTYRGGGIAIIGDPSKPDLTRPLISNNIIRENKAGEFGGGIYNKYAHPIIINNEITHDSASQGGGIGSSFDASGSYRTQIMGNQIDSNAANRGRALYFEESNAILRNNTIRHNNRPNPQYNTGIIFPATVDFGDVDGANGPGYNWLEDNGSHDISSSGDGLQAEGNYWATLNTSDILDRIDPYSGSIDFDPVAASDRIASVGDVEYCNTDVIVTGDLTVGGSLTIAPEKTFYFTNPADINIGISLGLCELIINGELHAQGTETQKINFIPFPQLPPPGDINWYGIRLRPNSTADFKNCIINHAYCGLDAELSSSLTVDSSIIEQNELSGMKIYQVGNVVIKHNTITTNGIYGISCNTVNATITGNEILNSGRYGIEYKLNTDEAVIDSNHIAWTLPQAPTTLYALYPCRLDERASIDSNDIETYDQAGICCYDETRAQLYRNTIMNNNGYGNGLLCSYGSSPYVRNCTIDGNKAGVYCDQNSYPNLGTIDDPGNNSILMRNGYWVVNKNLPQGQIYAQLNWWGTPTPDQFPSRFIGWVIYRPWLLGPPEGGGQSANVMNPPPIFALYSPKPNPAKQFVKITYSLPSREKAGLFICDASGRIITKTTEEKELGRYEYLWQGKDQRGKEVPNGIYIVRLKAGNNLQTQKITLVR